MAAPPQQIRRLSAQDAEAFRALRLEGFTLCERAFRFAPQDEACFDLDHFRRRLADEHVFGAFHSAELVGVGGLTRYKEQKLRHKALLWGMYVRMPYQGAGVADRLMAALIEAARSQEGVEQVLLTVVADNARARRFYERWGFGLYGVEPRSAKLGDGEYLDEALMILHF